MLLQRIRDGERANVAPPPTPVSLPDRELLRLVAEGKTNEEIGGELVIDADAVGKHVSAVLTKLQADAQAAARASRNGSL
jgi:DNA-binding NarL/FixJ family response regulator